MKQAVMWREIHEKEKRSLTKWLVRTNIFWVLISLFLYQGWAYVHRVDPEVFGLKNQIKEYKVRDEIFNILRVKGVSLSQGIDIANALIVHCRENKIPLELGLGIMKQESQFYVNAISNRKARGLMQLMPDTFDSYNKNLRLGLTRQAIFDPIINIKIATRHLKDIFDEQKSKKEEEAWRKALVAYSGGAKDYAKTVIRSSEEYKEKLK